MEQVTLQVPKMWADHHVHVVRRALSGLGVAEIEASAARRLVRLGYDPARVRREQILQALAEAGYAPTAVAEFPAAPANKERESSWVVREARVTQTNRLDLEMSGDFRKY